MSTADPEITIEYGMFGISENWPVAVADLAIAGDGEWAYFVYLVSGPDEHEYLFGQLFPPAVEAMAPLG